MTALELQQAIAAMGAEAADAMGYTAALLTLTRREFEEWYGDDAAERFDAHGGYGTGQRCHINASWVAFKAARGLK